MVIIGEPYGQLGNRLSLWAHFLAAGRQHRFRVMNLAFSDYSPLFRLESSDPVVIPPSRLRLGTLGTKLLRRISVDGSGGRRILPGVRVMDGTPNPFDLSLPEIHEPLRRGVHITRGWGFRDHAAVELHADFLRDFFRPAPEHEAEVDRHHQILRTDGKKLVGVHLRRGDFREFRGGGFHYSDQIYLEWMGQVSDRLGSDSIRFVLFSNETLDLEVFRAAGFQVEVGPGSIAQDLYLMARCDLLLGPPSTFSSWASFYGQVPLGMIHPNERPGELNFQVLSSA